MWKRYHLFLAALLVIAGSINTITLKWSDRTVSVGRDGVAKNFHHSFFQANCMFAGEFLCLVFYQTAFWIFSRRGDGSEDESKLTSGYRDFNRFILYIPAFCDMTATSIQYVGLNLTYASSFQMLRGAVIIFVGLFSMIFLKRKLGLQKWTGIGFVILGLALVGLADYVSTGTDETLNTEEIIFGDLLIVFAQVIVATQDVLEEKFVQGQNIPSLQAVGLEGAYGFITLGFLMIPLYFIKADRPLTQHKGDRVEDVIDAFVQIGNSWQLCLAVTMNVISISFFNFAGVSITKEISATTRKVLDSIRTIVIWGFSLAFFEQAFHWLQLLGFCFLIFGMCLYNDIVGPSTLSICTGTGREEEDTANAEAAGTK